MPENSLYGNIAKKRKRIAAGSGEKMRKPGTKGAPTASAFKKGFSHPPSNPGLASSTMSTLSPKANSSGATAYQPFFTH